MDCNQSVLSVPRSSKLWHRAPLEARGSLSHIRKTLKPGVSVLPLLPASFDAVGQWRLCCAGASPTEDPSYRCLIYDTPLEYVKGPKMSHTARDKEKLVLRVRRIRGQIEALE